jgi:hypothetical protein
MASVQDQLLPAIRSLVADLLQEVPGSDRANLNDYLSMAETSPIIGSALQYIGLAGSIGLGEFRHSDPEIQAGTRAQFEGMRGSLALSAEELVGASYGLGNGVASWGVEEFEGSLRLIDIAIVNPRDYSFKGRVGSVESVRYSGSTPAVDVPYGGAEGRIIHVINNRAMAFREPKGIPALKRCLAPWRAWKIVIGEMLVAAQRQATPIIVGYSDSGITVPLLNSAGQPLLNTDGSAQLIQAPAALLEQLKALDNRSVISTDIGNKIESLSQQSNGMFFFEALRYLQQLQLMGLLFPETILTATGVGDSNLNTGHRATLDIVVGALIAQLREAILEGPVRFLITANYGDQDSYGSFELPDPVATAQEKSALLDAIGRAVSTGLLPASDPSVQGRGYELAGLPAPESASLSSRILPADYWRVA